MNLNLCCYIFFQNCRNICFRRKLPNRWCCCRDLNHCIISMQKSSERGLWEFPHLKSQKDQNGTLSSLSANGQACIIWKVREDFLMCWGQAVTSLLQTPFKHDPKPKWVSAKGEQSGLSGFSPPTSSPRMFQGLLVKAINMKISFW